jgi:hypothetical protein
VGSPPAHACALESSAVSCNIMKNGIGLGASKLGNDKSLKRGKW